ncbi:MAG: SOS response-associated peptidase family protein, partial [Desulfovermiculus sp.]
MGCRKINARAKTIFAKPAYTAAAKRHSCLISTSCFFEWKRGEKEAKKQPYCIRSKDKELFAFAGIWEHWEDKEAGFSINCCTIVTTRANKAVQELHDKMPVIIARESFGLCLDRSLQEP